MKMKPTYNDWENDSFLSECFDEEKDETKSVLSMDSFSEILKHDYKIIKQTSNVFEIRPLVPVKMIESVVMNNNNNITIIDSKTPVNNMKTMTSLFVVDCAEKLITFTVAYDSKRAELCCTPLFARKPEYTTKSKFYIENQVPIIPTIRKNLVKKKPYKSLKYVLDDVDEEDFSNNPEDNEEEHLEDSKTNDPKEHVVIATAAAAVIQEPSFNKENDFPSLGDLNKQDEWILVTDDSKPSFASIIANSSLTMATSKGNTPAKVMTSPPIHKTIVHLKRKAKMCNYDDAVDFDYFDEKHMNMVSATYKRTSKRC